MLLRSSSSPILGSLLHSTASSSLFHESPGSNQPHHQQLQSLEGTRFSGDLWKHVSFSSPTHHPAPIHSSCTSDFRRVSSEGNLEGLPASSDLSGDVLRRSAPSPMRHGAPRPGTLLDAKDPGEGEEQEEEGVREAEERGLRRSLTFRDTVGGELAFLGKGPDDGGEMEVGGSPLFLAVGLGINVNDASSAFVNVGGAGGCIGRGGGGGRGPGSPVLKDNSGDKSDLEMFYKKMVEENPCDALFLRNYAQFLYEIKEDPQRAEEYYCRAILAEPGDGEILSQYARLIWDLYRDRDRASWYYDQAVEAAPQDSHVLAAYANFLWETEAQCDLGSYDEPPIAVGAVASASA